MSLHDFQDLLTQGTGLSLASGVEAGVNAAQPRLDEMRAQSTWFEQTGADYAASRWSTAEA